MYLHPLTLAVIVIMLQSRDKLCGWVGGCNCCVRLPSWLFMHTCTSTLKTWEGLGTRLAHSQTVSLLVFCAETRNFLSSHLVCMRLLWSVCSSWWHFFAICYIWSERKYGTRLCPVCIECVCVCVCVCVCRVTIFEGSYFILLLVPSLWYLCTIGIWK